MVVAIPLTIAEEKLEEDDFAHEQQCDQYNADAQTPLSGLTRRSFAYTNNEMFLFEAISCSPRLAFAVVVEVSVEYLVVSGAVEFPIVPG